MTLLLVLVLLTTTVLGGLALARLSSAGIFIAGNAASKQGSLQASEVGINSAFDAVLGVGNDDVAVTGWYFPVAQPVGSDGVPRGIDWSATPSVTVDPYDVRYVVERLCSVAPVSDVDHECMVKTSSGPKSGKHGAPSITAPAAKQYRITVRVFMASTGTTTFVQALMQR
ncbi:MAG TPA: hypothetical protein VJN68_09660 [Burkholderiaceae bacterium]|nr:hypothetical protein [Burkholderiaceae bacterium]